MDLCNYFYINESDIIIKLDDIKIEDIKIEQLLNKINNNNKPFEESNINNNTFTIIEKNNGICEILSKEEQVMFNKFINSKVSFTVYWKRKKLNHIKLINVPI